MNARAALGAGRRRIAWLVIGIRSAHDYASLALGSVARGDALCLWFRSLALAHAARARQRRAIRSRGMSVRHKLTASLEYREPLAA